MQLILGLALAAAVFVILKKWGALSPEGQKAAIWKVVLVAGGALLLFMVLTGRVHVITAGIAALIPLLRKLPALMRYAPMFRKAMGDSSGPESAGQAGAGEQRAPVVGAMTEREACDILGVKPGCSRERSEEHTSELQSRPHLVCRLL